MHEPLTRTKSVIERIEAPVGLVWRIVSDFPGVGRFMRRVTVLSVVGEGVGAVRTISLPECSLQERLEILDAERHVFSYRVLDPSPLGVGGYVAEIRLEADNDACRIEWFGQFVTASTVDPAAVSERAQVAYRAAIASLKTVVADDLAAGRVE